MTDNSHGDAGDLVARLRKSGPTGAYWPLRYEAADFISVQQAEIDRLRREATVSKAAVSPDWRGHERARGKLSLAIGRAEAAERVVEAARAYRTTGNYQAVRDALTAFDEAKK